MENKTTEEQILEQLIIQNKQLKSIKNIQDFFFVVTIVVISLSVLGAFLAILASL